MSKVSSRKNRKTTKKYIAQERKIFLKKKNKKLTICSWTLQKSLRR